MKAESERKRVEKVIKIGTGDKAHLDNVLFCHMHGPGSNMTSTILKEILVLWSFSE